MYTNYIQVITELVLILIRKS